MYKHTMVWQAVHQKTGEVIDLPRYSVPQEPLDDHLNGMEAEGWTLVTMTTIQSSVNVGFNHAIASQHTLVWHR